MQRNGLDKMKSSAMRAFSPEHYGFAPPLRQHSIHRLTIIPAVLQRCATIHLRATGAKINQPNQLHRVCSCALLLHLSS